MLPAVPMLIRLCFAQAAATAAALPAAVEPAAAPASSVDLSGWAGIALQVLSLAVAFGLFLWRSGANMKDEQNKREKSEERITNIAKEMGASVASLQQDVSELRSEGKVRANTIIEMQRDLAQSQKIPSCQLAHQAVANTIQALKDAQAVDRAAADTAVKLLQHDVTGMRQTLDEMRKDIKAILNSRNPTLRPGQVPSDD